MVRFRPNVAALMIRESGELLICERLHVPGAWQFPQGGMDAGESALESLHREVEEEIGLGSGSYEVVDQRPGYRYLYPEAIRAKKARKHGCHGQEQTYFLCRVREPEPAIDLNREPREFAAYRWIRPEDFDLAWVPGFKQQVYREVFRDFFEVEI